MTNCLLCFNWFVYFFILNTLIAIIHSSGPVTYEKWHVHIHTLTHSFTKAFEIVKLYLNILKHSLSTYKKKQVDDMKNHINDIKLNNII